MISLIQKGANEHGKEIR